MKFEALVSKEELCLQRRILTDEFGRLGDITPVQKRLLAILVKSFRHFLDMCIANQ